MLFFSFSHKYVPDSLFVNVRYAVGPCQPVNAMVCQPHREHNLFLHASGAIKGIVFPPDCQTQQYRQNNNRCKGNNIKVSENECLY